MGNEKRWKGIAALVAAFVLGTAAGGGIAYGFAQHRYARVIGDRPEMMDMRRIGALTRRLGLDPTQRERVHAIIEKHAGERRDLERAMFDRCGDQIRAKQAEIDGELRAVLDVDQQQRFDAMSKRVEGRREEKPDSPR